MADDSQRDAVDHTMVAILDLIGNAKLALRSRSAGLTEPPVYLDVTCDVRAEA